MKRLHGSWSESVKREPCLNLAATADFYGFVLQSMPRVKAWLAGSLKVTISSRYRWPEWRLWLIFPMFAAMRRRSPKKARRTGET